ncbi:PAS domain S-box protein [Mucilaginibacter sp. AW1-3]
MKSIALRIVLIYEFAGILWIAISDLLFYRIEGPKETLMMYIGTTSAMLFLIITGFILHKLINLHYNRLQQSEKQYRTYFEDNPTPMWIYDRKTLGFIAVNDAAVFNYGYTKDEFYNMTIMDIRPQEDSGKVMDALINFDTAYKNFGTWHHKRKDGSDIYVHVTSHLTLANNEQHVMIMAEDITKRLETEARLHEVNTELVRQNNLLREISWSQSHNVRRPLASILGLLNVIRISNNELEKELCINYIEISASELDIMVYNINEQINKAVYADSPDLKPEVPMTAGSLD